jgi:vesicle coat complex subunit
MRRVFLAALLAAAAAGGCGPAAPTLAGGKPVGQWVASLHDPDARVRKEAARELGNVGTADPAALPALKAALKDPDAGVRCEAILALVKSPAAAKDAVPTLTDLQQNDPDPKVRSDAGRAVERIQGGKGS